MAVNTFFYRSLSSGSISASMNVSTDTRDYGDCRLVPGRTYFARIGIQTGNDACKWSNSCYQWGNTVSFTTRTARLPIIGTSTLSQVGPDSVVVSASVTSSDGDASVGVEVSRTSVFSNSRRVSSGLKIETGSSYGMLPMPKMYDGSTSITGLLEDTEYFVRVYAQTEYGTQFGEVKSFRTRPPVGVSINSADEYTNDPDVILGISWPLNTESVLVSNDGGFRQQQNFDLNETINWTLKSSGDERLPKTVYMKFIMTDGSRSAAFSDDIILDTTAPVLLATSAARSTSSGGVSIAAAKDGVGRSYRISVSSQDNNSGVSKVLIRSSIGGKISHIAVKRSSKSRVKVGIRTTRRIVYVSVEDGAGNRARVWKKIALR